MTENEDDLRARVHRWIAAIQACDLDGVAADHADDIVLFDVPPPYDGIRGIDAYRDSWPMFFEYLAGGALLDLVELNVVAGDSAGFAYGLLRCGTPVELTAKPERRLRFTIGFRKRDGRWQVAHEHHSFPME